MMLLQEIVGIATRFIDSCLYSASQEFSMFEKMKMTKIQDFIAALNNFEFGNQGSGDNISPINFESDLLARQFAVYDIPASAGTGVFLDSEDYEIMSFPASSIPLDATFGVWINGDSMTPEMQDGDIVLVK